MRARYDVLRPISHVILAPSGGIKRLKQFAHARTPSLCSALQYQKFQLAPQGGATEFLSRGQRHQRRWFLASWGPKPFPLKMRPTETKHRPVSPI